MNNKMRQIIDTAKSLFWRYGMRRVSIEEICREAKVSKMTFYKYFSNKVELVKFILNQIVEDSVKEYKDLMSQNIPFEEKVRQSIQLKMKQTNKLSHEFYSDLHQNAPPDIRKHFEAMTQRSIQLIVDDYNQAQKDGNIRKDLKIEFILYFLNQIFKMANDPQLVALYESPQALIMEITNFFFYGILPYNEH